MPKFEAEILYEGGHKATLDTYAESMGASVAYIGESGHAVLQLSGDREKDLLKEMESAIEFFNGEDVHPLNWRIVRVIYDSVTGYDEINDVDDEGAGVYNL